MPRRERARQALQVELEMSFTAGREKAVIVGIGLGEAAREPVVDLVGFAGDGRADRRGDAGAVGAEQLHRGDRGLDHPAQRALPAGMGGADHAGIRVGEQDRRAVGGEDAERQAGPVGDDFIGIRAAIVGPGLEAEGQNLAERKETGDGRFGGGTGRGGRGRTPRRAAANGARR